MEAKHTPGPWTHRNGRIFATDRENLTIANVARAADGDYSPANGQVIAAAPELLAALRGLVAQVDAGTSPEYRALQEHRSMRVARAATA